jgi:hypothetical protein
MTTVLSFLNTRYTSTTKKSSQRLAYVTLYRSFYLELPYRAVSMTLGAQLLCSLKAGIDKGVLGPLAGQSLDFVSPCPYLRSDSRSQVPEIGTVTS